MFHNANGDVSNRSYRHIGHKVIPLRETLIMSVKVSFPVDHTDELKMCDLLFGYLLVVLWDPLHFCLSI